MVLPLFHLTLQVPSLSDNVCIFRWALFILTKVVQHSSFTYARSKLQTRTGKQDYKTIKCLYSKQINKVKRQPTRWEKMAGDHSPNSEFKMQSSRIWNNSMQGHKELQWKWARGLTEALKWMHTDGQNIYRQNAHHQLLLGNCSLGTQWGIPSCSWECLLTEWKGAMLRRCENWKRDEPLGVQIRATITENC